MTEARDQRLDIVVARSLRWGAYIAFAILLAGLISTPFLPTRTTYLIASVGVVVMMSTPAFRVLIAIIVFLRERDYKYTLVATGVLLILLLGSIFGIGEH
jgi:uncharacterized membrane protein